MIRRCIEFPALHEHFGLQLEPTVPPSPDGPAGCEALVVVAGAGWLGAAAAGAGSLLTGAALEVGEELELLYELVLDAVGGATTGGALALRLTGGLRLEWRARPRVACRG
jgi:hypothetical protein